MADAITNLLAALSQVLILIALGFISAKANLIPKGSAPGIGLIVGTFALPSLFLLNAAQMDIAAFDVRVLVGVILARYFMIGLACGASRLLEPNATNKKGIMGLFALFCTQSNDVAIGLPIVTAIYPPDQYPANYPGYLIILSTLQVVIVNPMCILLLEWGKSELEACNLDIADSLGSIESPDTGSIVGTGDDSAEVPRRSIAVTVLRGVATSPLVVGSVVGVVINLSCGRDCLTSGVAGDTLQKVGNAFTFCALFLTGMSMDAKASPDESADGESEDSSISDSLTVTVLVLGKSLIHPIAIRLVLSILLPSPSSDLTEVKDFGYLYGTLPVASLPVVLANQHHLKPAMIAIASVVSTFISMPLLLVSATIFLNVHSESIYTVSRLLSEAAGIVSILALLVCLAVYAHRGVICSVPPTLVILHLGISQCLFHASLLGCEFATGDEGGTHILYWVTSYARSAQNTWFSNLALYFLLLVRCRYQTMAPLSMWIMYAFGWGFPLLLTLGGYLIGGNAQGPVMASYHALCWYRSVDQIYPDAVLTMLYFLIIVSAFVFTRKVPQSGPETDRSHHEVLLNQQEGFAAISSSSLDFSESLQSEFELDDLIQVSYSQRVKAVLAIGFVRLCFILALQFQMLSRVSPDGSFQVQMMFAVFLVDGGGAITALVFLWRSPLLNEMIAWYSTFFSKVKVEGQEVPWMGQPDDADYSQLHRHSISGRSSWSAQTAPALVRGASAAIPHRMEEVEEEEQYTPSSRSVPDHLSTRMLFPRQASRITPSVKTDAHHT